MSQTYNGFFAAKPRRQVQFSPFFCSQHLHTSFVSFKILCIRKISTSVKKKMSNSLVIISLENQCMKRAIKGNFMQTWHQWATNHGFFACFCIMPIWCKECTERMQKVVRVQCTYKPIMKNHYWKLVNMRTEVQHFARGWMNDAANEKCSIKISEVR